MWRDRRDQGLIAGHARAIAHSIGALRVRATGPRGIDCVCQASKLVSHACLLACLLACVCRRGVEPTEAACDVARRHILWGKSTGTSERRRPVAAAVAKVAAAAAAAAPAGYSPCCLATLRAAITLCCSLPSHLRRLQLSLAAAAGVAVTLHPQLRHFVSGLSALLRAERLRLARVLTGAPLRALAPRRASSLSSPRASAEHGSRGTAEARRHPRPRRVADAARVTARGSCMQGGGGAQGGDGAALDRVRWQDRRRGAQRRPRRRRQRRRPRRRRRRRR